MIDATFCINIIVTKLILFRFDWIEKCYNRVSSIVLRYICKYLYQQFL